MFLRDTPPWAQAVNNTCTWRFRGCKTSAQDDFLEHSPNFVWYGVTTVATPAREAGHLPGAPFTARVCKVDPRVSRGVPGQS